MNLYRYENILLNQNGTPITGASVWVCAGSVIPNFSTTPPGPLQPIYSDILGALPITQPILTSPLGNYAFCAAPGSVCTVVFVAAGLQSSDIVTIPQIISEIQTIEVDGVQYTNLQQAFAALPAAGGTIDMRGNGNAAALALGTFDPGTKSVTVLLGPYSYTVNQIILQTSLQIIGISSTTGVGGNPATVLNATGGNSTPPFVLGSAAGIGSVTLANFTLNGTAGNTSQNGINLIAPINGGLWYSLFENVKIFSFGGIGINLDAQTGGASGGIHQFNTFQRVIVTRPANGSYALQIIGRANSLKFENCEFDGTFNTQDGGTNINISQGTATIFPPYNIKFDLVTCQYAGTGFLITGADSVSIDQGHFEAVERAFNISSGSSFGALNITIHDSGFFLNSGIGTASPGVGVGTGYIIKNNGSTGNVSIALIDSHVISTPDAFLTGNTGSIVSFGNVIGPEGSYAYQPMQTGSPVGFGAGSAGTAVTTTTKGGGSGPTTPQTIVQYQQVTLSGVVFWIPLCQ